MSDTMVVMLAAGETFISSEGRMYKKGEHYELPRSDANTLLSSIDDYGVRFFKKSTQVPTQGQAINVNDKAVLPTTEEIAADIGIPPRVENSSQGELDTAEQQRGRGRPSRQVQV